MADYHRWTDIGRALNIAAWFHSCAFTNEHWALCDDCPRHNIACYYAIVAKDFSYQFWPSMEKFPYYISSLEELADLRVTKIKEGARMHSHVYLLLA
jgi:hypothetical protein